MHKAYGGDGLKLLAIYGVINKEFDTEEGTREFTQANEYSFPVFFDAENALVERFGVKRFPVAFLVDDRRKIIWTGDPRRATSEAAIEQHLLDRQ